MSIRARRLALFLPCVALLALSCATRGPVPKSDPPGRNTIRAESAGFSPTGVGEGRRIVLALGYASRNLPQRWKVQIVTSSIVVKEFEGEGEGDALPAELVWDGRTEKGAIWPEAEYYAYFSVDYLGAYYPGETAWDRFFLVASPPGLALSADPPVFTPEGSGMAGPVRLGLVARATRARLAGWTMEVSDEAGAVVKTFAGTAADSAALWDGSLDQGGFAEPSRTYTARAELRDEFGNVGRASIQVAVRVQTAPPETSIIETDRRGFSPTSDRGGGVIDFSMKIGNREAALSWAVEIAGPGGARRSFAGSAANAPSSLSWDGRDNSGKPAPEGSYSARLTVDYGRSYMAAQARTKDFILALSPPDCRLSASPEAFVPSEKGVVSPVAILLEARPRLARIESWTLDILDSQGRNVRSFAPDWPTNQVVWDGQSSTKQIVEAGSRYLAKAVIVDEFGNKAYASLPISVKEIPPATELSVIEPRSSGFSPQASGKPRFVDFILVAGNADQMKSWKVTISHSERGTERVFSGLAADFRRDLRWDGKTDTGAVAPDGSYNAQLTIDYGKSYRPASVKGAPFSLQAAPPEASLAIDPPLLTPRAGTFVSPVSIGLDASARFAEIESWIVSILDPAGNTVALYKDTTPGGRMAWDGRTNSGGLAEPSTSYSVLAEVRDSYGNTGFARALIPVADLPPVPGESAIVPSANGFSPDGDGTMDGIDLTLTVPNPEAVKAWKVTIGQVGGGVQKTFTGDALSLKDLITWGGRSDSGTASPEGFYTASMRIDYGVTYKTITAESRRFLLDSTAPQATLQLPTEALLPDDKGLVAPAEILLDASSALARMASWRLSVVDSGGKAFGSWEGAWPPKRIAWSGVAEDGSLAEPGARYFVTATVRDEFGIADQVKGSIGVDALPPATEASGASAGAKGFSPQANGEIGIALTFGNRNLIKSWSLDIERENRTVRMSYPGDGQNLPETFSWNGRLQDGAIAPDGLYRAILHVDYGRVYAPAQASSEAFALVAVAPTGSISISPPLFSPDGSGTGDKVTIDLQAESRYAKINDWSVEISDPGGNAFASFRGQWPAKTIVWDGRNAKGELVESAEDYPVLAKVRDEYGNSLELKSAVHVDILIVNMGDGYRIRIASIVFKPFTADYLNVAPEIAEKNVTTLNLLADKLRKFPGYQIRMVGHAVMVNWDNPALGKIEQERELLPLSKARAEAIMQALAARGIEPGRMVTDGVGASEQIVPDSDFANRWKNRRVEFFLRKK
jgi:flagellar hook assembly protein FlgD